MLFRDTCNSLLRRYLQQRQQYIAAMVYNSQLPAIEYEVPQGPVLGPLLYIVYISGLSVQKLKLRYYSYPDDTITLYMGNKVGHMQINCVLVQTKPYI